MQHLYVQFGWWINRVVVEMLLGWHLEYHSRLNIRDFDWLNDCTDDAVTVVAEGMLPVEVESGGFDDEIGESRLNFFEMNDRKFVGHVNSAENFK